MLTRASMHQTIRDYFNQQSVLEVETPLLCQHSVTDPYIDSLSSNHRWLQTSPEYAMKRLLCAGSGDIFQITKAFRADEAGHQHNPEFSMLEWYRLNFDHHQLMNDVERLVQTVLDIGPFQRISYQACWLGLTNIDPLNTSTEALHAFANQQQLIFADEHAPQSVDDWLMAIMGLYIEPLLAPQGPTFIYDFPASQSALARIDPTNPQVAQRFELYINGIELANGFHELTDATQQQARFSANNEQRRALNKPTMTIDPYFITALQHGLPNCSGVALGLDRLLMIKTKASAIKQVLCYDWERA